MSIINLSVFLLAGALLAPGLLHAAELGTNTPAPELAQLTPGQDDAPIARITSRILQQFNYRRQKFDDTVSSNFLARFVNDLDPQRLHFLDSDVAEFARYSPMLDDLTVRYGDTSPAYEIFARFFERLKDRTAYAENLLKTEKFTFDADERILVNRHTAPYPKDLAAAKQLWRDRLRFEYLQELLNSESPGRPKETNAPAAKPKTPAQIHDDIVKALTHRYDRILKMFKDWDSGDVLQFYLNTLAHVYDPHSDYFGKSQLEEFSLGMNLSLFGIGALLQTDDDGYCKIKELKPGPAKKSGKVSEGDRIVAVAQAGGEWVDVADMPLNKVVQLIRGPKNSEVRLKFWPAAATDPSARKVVTIIREEIKLEDQEAKAKLILVPDGKGGQLRVGVVDLPSFYATFDILSSHDKSTGRSTTADVTKLLVKLAEEKVDGVILDLRNNGGGSLEEAIKLTGLFIKHGPVVQVREPGGAVTVKEDTDESELYDGPLIVLTSRFTASASEIVAGALQDYGRALIVGDSSTHGKGTVQTLCQLAPYLHGNLWTTNDPGALKITIQKFYRPSGQSTQLKGVVPDIVLPSRNNFADVGETALESPLSWDTIDGAQYERMNRIEPFIAELRRRSDRRVATEKDFGYVREDIEQFKKSKDDKTVSLNEAQRLKEIKEDDARAKSRDRERLARKTPGPTLYEITLKQAEAAGLPAPVAKTNAVAGAEADEEKAPDVDVNLEEAEKILADYRELAATNTVAAALR